MLGSDEDVPFEDMMKALQGTGLAQPTEETPRALFHDPYSVMDWGGWRQRPSSLTYETLRQMASQNSIVAAIIQTRINQVAQFARPQQGDYDKGYRVILRDRRDGSKGMSDAEQKMANDIEQMLETTGVLLPDEKPSDRDSYRAFLRKSVRDILTYDAWSFEKIRDQTGAVSRFICLPGETIRPAVVDKEHMSPKDARSRVAYVQVYDNTVISEFGIDDLAWCVMNPRSDLRVNGFGYAPLEQITRLVTAWLYGFDYNQRFFTQGSAVKGVLNIKGSIPDRQLRAFRRMWYSMVSGVQNAWRTPILNSEDIQWVNLHANNREMEFGAWMDWITKITCSVFGIDPVEINFIFSGAGRNGSMFGSRPNAEEVVESKDKGLRPLLDHITDSINQHIIWEIAPDLEFAFTGFDAKAEEKERERRDKEVTRWKTVDEVRAEIDLDPLPDGQGEVILDPTWLQFTQGKQAMEQGDGEGGPPGVAGFGDDDGDDGDDEGDDDNGNGEGAPPGGSDKGQESGKPDFGDLKRSMDVMLDRLRKGERVETIADGRRTLDVEL